MSIQEIEREIATMPLSEARRLRRLIDARLQAHEEIASAPESLYDRMKHLIGDGEDPATPDLSSNKEYLRDLGESPLR
ncbi:MAG: hypothetical protein AAF089_17410 [Bacteroidota bacterium]